MPPVGSSIGYVFLAVLLFAVILSGMIAAGDVGCRGDEISEDSSSCSSEEEGGDGPEHVPGAVRGQ